MRACTSITSLNIERTQVNDDDLSKLSLFPELWSVVLDDRQLADLGARHLAALPKLTQLVVNVYDSTWTGEPLLHLPKLTQLEIDHHGTDSQLLHVASLRNLTELHLAEGTDVTDQGLAFLAKSPSLQGLSIGNKAQQITDAGLEHLQTLKTLRRSQLSGTKVTPAGIAKFKAALPDCEVTFDSISETAP